MGDKQVKVGRTAEYEQTNGVATRLGRMLVETSRGLVSASDAPGYTTMLIEDTAGGRRIGFMLYDVAELGAAAGIGLIAQMTGDQARTIAASLWRLAAQIDPKAPN